MFAALLKFILGFFNGKELTPAHAKVMFSIISFILTYNLVSIEKIKDKLGEVSGRVNETPALIFNANRVLADELYKDATSYAAEIVQAIQESNIDILHEIDLSDEQRNRAVRQIEARFENLVNRVKQIEKEQHYQVPDSIPGKPYRPGIRHRQLNMIDYFIKPKELKIKNFDG